MRTPSTTTRRHDLDAEEQRRTRELAALYTVATAINEALTEQEALTQALKQVLPVLNLDSGRIYLWDRDAEQLTLVAAQGDPELLDPSETTITPGECLCGMAVARGLPLVAQDAGNDPQISLIGCRRHSGHAYAAEPLLAKGRVLGVLHVAAGSGVPFSDGDLALLRSVAAQIGVAVENFRLREEARRAETLTALLQEMHHRIKNNLQTVADLLSLELSASPSPAARKSLRDSIGRIKSIAAVHELLSLEQLRLTDITELARQVCDISLKHLVWPDRRVSATVEGPAIFLPSKQATALALVMNELIANALEHAFGPNSDDGRLAIAIEQEGAEVTVTVADNGRGLPSGFDPSARLGMGLQIAQTLVEKDLAGSLRLQNAVEGGVRATLTFYK